MLPQLQRPRRLLVRTAAVGLALLILFGLPSTLHYLALTQEIARRFYAVEPAKVLVIAKAMDLGVAGLATLSDYPDPTITIGPDSGVVTLTLRGLPDVEGSTLTVLPVVEREGTVYPLRVYMDRGYDIRDGLVHWKCVGQDARSHDPYIVNNRGTLESQYAPAECR